jgi:UDP-N-acetylglucosamine 4,6-dehydratase
MSQLDGASVLITGGTGSLGKSLAEYLLKETKVRRIAIFSRDDKWALALVSDPAAFKLRSILA